MSWSWGSNPKYLTVPCATPALSARSGTVMPSSRIRVATAAVVVNGLIILAEYGVVRVNSQCYEHPRRVPFDKLKPVPRQQLM